MVTFRPQLCFMFMFFPNKKRFETQLKSVLLWGGESMVFVHKMAHTTNSMAEEKFKFHNHYMDTIHYTYFLS